MDLVEIYGINAEPSEAGLTLLSDGIGFETVADLPALIPDHAAFGK